MGSEMCIRDRDSERAHGDGLGYKNVVRSWSGGGFREKNGGMRWWAGGPCC